MKTTTSIASAILLILAACGGGDGESACPPDQAYFVENVWTPILSVSCIACHNADGVARGTRLVLRTPDQADFLADNLRIVSEVARIEHDGTSVLLLRPSGRHPQGHAGGTVVAFEGAQYEALEEFVGRVVGDEAACAAAEGACVAGTPGPQQLRRLARDEFDNTIRDLFGFPSEWGAAFTADTVVNGYDNNARALTVSPLLADQVRKAAEEIAEQVKPNLAALLPCAPSQGRACAGEFIAGFGERVFRRPVTDDQVSRYLQVYDVGAEEGFEAGAELVIAAMLQSPSFLYRGEIGEHVGGGIYELTPYEIASELSYLLWRSMPDDELLAAARSGALRDPAEIERQALRMLASPKSRAALDRFTEQWLGIDQITVVPKDSGVFPELTSEIRTSMAEEAARLVADVTATGGALPDLLEARYSIMNSALAAFYGVSAPAAPDASGFGRVDLDDGHRGGLLTLGAVLTTHARPNDSSPVHRGKVVRERLLCQHLPPPPPGINAQPPGLDPSLTTRERYRQHSQDQACAGCHKLMDPIGFGFERFDGIGRFRDDENGQPIDDAGEIVHPDGGGDAFSGVAGLSQLLADSPDAQACFALQWFRFAYGVQESPQLRCVVDEVEEAFLAGNLGLQELILGLTRTSHFTRRVGPDLAAPPQEPTDPSDEEPTDPPDEEPDTGNVTVSVRTDSEWPTGSCHSATVTNTSSGDVDWQVTIAVNGQLNDYWNANAAQSGNQVTFSGVEWNDIIAPGGSAEFGYCLQR